MLQDEVHRLRDDALTLRVDVLQHAHRVGLPGACLAVDEVSSIVPIQDVVAQRQTSRLKDLVLVGRVLEYAVEAEVFWTLFGDHKREVVVVSWEGALPLGLRRLSTSGVENFVVDLVLEGRPDPDEDLHIFHLVEVGRTSQHRVIRLRYRPHIAPQLVRNTISVGLPDAEAERAHQIIVVGDLLRDLALTRAVRHVLIILLILNSVLVIVEVPSRACRRVMVQLTRFRLKMPRLRSLVLQDVIYPLIHIHF